MILFSLRNCDLSTTNSKGCSFLNGIIFSNPTSFISKVSWAIPTDISSDYSAIFSCQNYYNGLLMEHLDHPLLMTPEICVPSFPQTHLSGNLGYFFLLIKNLWVHVARIHCLHVGMAVESFTVLLLASCTIIQWPGIRKLWTVLACCSCDVCYFFWHPLASQLWCLPIHPAAVHHYVTATSCVFYMLWLWHSLSKSLCWMVSLEWKFLNSRECMWFALLSAASNEVIPLALVVRKPL